MRPYWSAGLTSRPPIRFEIIEVFAGIDSVSIFYRSVGRKLACETFFFDGERQGGPVRCDVRSVGYLMRRGPNTGPLGSCWPFR
jgi:hypothetical protein